VINPPTQVVLARPIEQRADPDQAVAALRQIWQRTFARDTSAMVTVLLATDWCYLHPGVIAAHRPAAAHERAVAGVGVGVAMAGTGHRQPQNFSLTESVDLCVDWIYLIDPVTAIVAVYAGDGQLATAQPLTG
jgi:hypothetical protein